MLRWYAEAWKGECIRLMADHTPRLLRAVERMVGRLIWRWYMSMLNRRARRLP